MKAQRTRAAPSDWVRCGECHGSGMLFRNDGPFTGIVKCRRCDGSGTTHRRLRKGVALFYEDMRR